MTKEIAKRIVKGITDKIECNTVDIDDWAEFWGFTREEYEEFLDLAIKALEREPKIGHWIDNKEGSIYCSFCGCGALYDKVYPGESVFGKVIRAKSTFCPTCGAKMEVET